MRDNPPPSSRRKSLQRLQLFGYAGQSRTNAYALLGVISHTQDAPLGLESRVGATHRGSRRQAARSREVVGANGTVPQQ
jgi:hypothetical protein